MSRLFRGAGLGMMVPVIQCDYQRCDHREQLSQPEPYPQGDSYRGVRLREAENSEWKTVRDERIRLLETAPRPRGWVRTSWTTNSSLDDNEVRDFCSWDHVRIYAKRMADNGL